MPYHAVRIVGSLAAMKAGSAASYGHDMITMPG
jgi:hypothetical protein